ncbi:FAD-binding protein [Desulfovibrio sp. OttesenSCG-928-C14]|nr:FAD-binding protein [Desulfovibrio sp. OttesenSCG-928-C14]
MKISRQIETDVLVVGGGIAGLMAAIRAAEEGAATLIAEKAHVRRSGSGATGNDHFFSYIPEYHGPDLAPILREVSVSQTALCQEGVMVRHHMENSFEVIKLWHDWGINMRPTGKWHFSGHAFPERPRIWLRYNGCNQKAVLSERAAQSGVSVLNHHPVLELIREEGAAGAVCGAVALDTSTPQGELVEIRAKAVIMATGCTTRLYSNEASPGWMFNQAYCPSCAGALAQGWRVGARMVNLELPNRHAGTKYFARCGKGTWVGVYRYLDGKPLGPFVTKPDINYGDMTSDIWSSAFTDVMRNGRGPAYLDCSELTPEEYQYVVEGMISEGLTAQLDYMRAEGIDPREHAIEFQQYEPHLFARGFDVNTRGETGVPGLYAAGDTIGTFRGGIAGAAVFGWSSGKAASEFAGQRPAAGAAPTQAAELVRARAERFMTRRNGPDWKEINLALQQVMSDYAAAAPYRVRSETLLSAGLHYIAYLKKMAEERLAASCSHTLMRAFEVLDLLDCGEMIMHGALERKESRALHQRSDYTFTNPLLADKFLQVWQENGKVQTAWRLKES